MAIPSVGPREIARITARPAPSTTLYVGGVPFGPLEHPNDLTFAIEQSLAEKTRIGGNRVGQPLGPQYDDISWSGRLYPEATQGITVTKRVRLWKGMAADGKSRELRWWTERYKVIVKRFAHTWLDNHHATYEMRVWVQSDLTNAAKTTSAPSVDQQVAKLVDLSASQVAAIANADATALPLVARFQQMQRQLAAAGPLAATPGVSAAPIIASVQKALAEAQKYAITAQGFFPRSHLLTVASLASTLSVTLKVVQQGQNAQTVRAFGGTIEDIALKHYGTISVARQLQRANSLASNVLPQGVVTLINLLPLAGLQ